MIINISIGVVMKNIIKLFASVIIFSFISINEIFPEVDGNPCLIIPYWMIGDGENWINPEDSIVIDTCIEKEGNYCLNKAIMLYIEKNIFKYDTLKLKGIYQWTDINDSLPNTKQMYKEIYDNFCEYHFEYDSLNVFHDDYDYLNIRMYFNKWKYFDSLFNYFNEYSYLHNSSYRQCYELPVTEKIRLVNEYDIFWKKNEEVLEFFISKCDYLSNNVIRIFDIYAREIFHKNYKFQDIIRISTYDYPSGFYFVNINNHFFKFIILR
jgi:hypothetical protein